MNITKIQTEGYRHILVTDIAPIKEALFLQYPYLTDKHYTQIILKAGYDLNVLHTRESKEVIDGIDELELISKLARQVGPIVYSLYRQTLCWTLQDPPDGGLSLFNGMRFWLCWK